MMISCSFNGIPCYTENFSIHWDNNHGNCYTFNYGNLVNSTKITFGNYTDHYAPNYNASISAFFQTSSHGPEDGFKLELAVSK